MLEAKVPDICAHELLFFLQSKSNERMEANPSEGNSWTALESLSVASFPG